MGNPLSVHLATGPSRMFHDREVSTGPQAQTTHPERQPASPLRWLTPASPVDTPARPIGPPQQRMAMDGNFICFWHSVKLSIKSCLGQGGGGRTHNRHANS